jgi:diaminohydroxyphosphoribosylaminopyrimidine deaminase / 5-amino-6-(5-phosphoribosylamino)uracil reductase
MDKDHQYMARALQLAAQGLYTTHPNPRVGCVMVRAGNIVGEGWHMRAGEPHAEIHALAQAGAQAQGATVYVTLEPCCHQGRTPPCTDTLIEAGVARVVAAMIDPNPNVAGQGLARLAAAGIATENGVLQAQAEALNAGFIMRMRERRPYVRCKLAMSVDGRTAMASGESKWITSDAAREDVQRLRASSAAILTGIGTVLADDPALTVRAEGVVRQPLRVVADSQLRISPQARLLKQPGRTLIVSTAQNAARCADLACDNVTVSVQSERSGQVDLALLMQTLAVDHEINEVLVEAGPTFNGALLNAGLIDEVIIYMAPHLMGDAARGLFHLPGLQQMSQRIALEIQDIRAVGRDWRITANIVRTS